MWLLLDHLNSSFRLQVLLLVLIGQVFTDNGRAGFKCCVHMSGFSRPLYLKLILKVYLAVSRSPVFSYLDGSTPSVGTVEERKSRLP